MMPGKHSPVLLIVDDTPLSQVLITRFLDGCGYTLEVASSGEEAWDMLQAAPERYHAVLLDRMMPGIDGMEVLTRIKRDARLKLLPVILQTAESAPEQVAEGLQAGAFYYLTKPFKPEVIRAVVATAVRDTALRKIELYAGEQKRQALKLLDEAHFKFRTPEEAHWIAGLVSTLCPSAEIAYMGIIELMLNAIEHGNLAIGYAEKTVLIAEERLAAEIARRLELPEYSCRTASFSYRRMQDGIRIAIRDEGGGFDWVPYLEMSMDRMMDNHGRGIAMARSLAFSRLEYSGKGNHVEASISTPA